MNLIYTERALKLMKCVADSVNAWSQPFKWLINTFILKYIFEWFTNARAITQHAAQIEFWERQDSQCSIIAFVCCFSLKKISKNNVKRVKWRLFLWYLGMLRNFTRISPQSHTISQLTKRGCVAGVPFSSFTVTTTFTSWNITAGEAQRNIWCAWRSRGLGTGHENGNGLDAWCSS